VANRLETKVVAATGGSGAGATVATFVLWLLGVTVWGVSNSADHAGDAIAAVPSPVAGLILIVVSALGAALGGWLAPHTPQTVTINGQTLQPVIVQPVGTVPPAGAPGPEAIVPIVTKGPTS
jgi:hypothetical protein